MNKQWKEAVVRPAMMGEILSRFGVFKIDGVYSVIHLITGFKAHQCNSAAEARAVAEALDPITEWDAVSLAPGGATVIGVSDALKTATIEARTRAIAEPKSAGQSEIDGAGT